MRHTDHGTQGAARVAKIFLALLGLLGMAVLPGAAMAQAAGEKTKIVFWRTFQGPSARAQEELVKRFNESQKEVEVEAQFQGIYLELAQKFQAAIAARQLPDLITLDTGLMEPFARDGMLEPLDALLDGPSGIQRGSFQPGMLNLGLVRGKQYLIPFAISTPVLYYNRDMFARAGVKAPPATWDELFSTARQINKSLGGTFGLTYELRFWWWQPQVWAQGGQVSNARYETFVDSPVWQQELGKLQDLVCREKVANIPPRAAGGTQGDMSNRRAAMTIASSAQLANFIAQAKDYKLGVAPLPGGPAGRIAPLGGSGLVVPKGISPKKLEAVWKFIRFMTSPQSNAYFASQSGYLPITKGAEVAMSGFTASNPLWRVPINQLRFTRNNSELHDTREALPVINNTLERILLNCEDPKAVLPQAQQRTLDALKSEGLR
ncbi:MAG: ABC transporter substrate-binding protein [Meiothermus sp.]|nr:ABC transporter substrate-binding protein [Meiothermus sp.]